MLYVENRSWYIQNDHLPRWIQNYK